MDELEKILKAYANRPKDLARAIFKTLQAKEIKDIWDIFAPGSGAPLREEIKVGPPLAATGGDLGHAESLYSNPQPQSVQVEETGVLARLLESVIGKALAQHSAEMKVALSAILERVGKAEKEDKEDEDEEEEMEKAVRVLLMALSNKKKEDAEEDKEEKKEDETEKSVRKILGILTGKSENDKESDEKLTNQASHQEEGKANAKHDAEGKFAEKEEDKEKALDKALQRIVALEEQIKSLPSGKLAPSFTGLPDITVKAGIDVATRLSGFLSRDASKLDRSLYGQLEYLYKSFVSTLSGGISKGEFEKALCTFNPEAQEQFMSYLKEAGVS